MSTSMIRGVVRGGRIEVETPIDLPDGTELLIPLPEATSAPAEVEVRGDNSPEAIAAWLAWFDALPTLKITPEEEADTAAWQKRMGAHASGQMEKELEDLFP